MASNKKICKQKREMAAEKRRKARSRKTQRKLRQLAEQNRLIVA